VLLLDEPTSALDRPTVDSLAASLKAACRQRRLAVLLVTHDLHLARAVADDLAYLEEGRILEQGAAGDLLRRPHSAALQGFLAPPRREQD
jgi:putative ABC transport system ATP-binding protein